jgi:hypothetical protein
MVGPQGLLTHSSQNSQICSSWTIQINEYHELAMLLSTAEEKKERKNEGREGKEKLPW